MILSFCVCLKEIMEKGKEFPWPKPDRCPECNSNRLWGHGFVEAIFDGCSDWVWLKRYRCPDCRRVFRTRPSGYFRRFQVPINFIRSCIAYMQCYGSWPDQVSRSRQDYWFRNLCRNVCGRYGLAWLDRLLEGFDRLCKQKDERPPVSRPK